MTKTAMLEGNGAKNILRTVWIHWIRAGDLFCQGEIQDHIETARTSTRVQLACMKCALIWTKGMHTRTSFRKAFLEWGDERHGYPSIEKHIWIWSCQKGSISRSGHNSRLEARASNPQAKEPIFLQSRLRITS